MLVLKLLLLCGHLTLKTEEARSNVGVHRSLRKWNQKLGHLWCIPVLEKGAMQLRVMVCFIYLRVLVNTHIDHVFEFKLGSLAI